MSEFFDLYEYLSWLIDYDLVLYYYWVFLFVIGEFSARGYAISLYRSVCHHLSGHNL